MLDVCVCLCGLLVCRFAYLVRPPRVAPRSRCVCGISWNQNLCHCLNGLIQLLLSLLKPGGPGPRAPPPTHTSNKQPQATTSNNNKQQQQQQNWLENLDGTFGRNIWPEKLAGRFGRNIWPEHLAGTFGQNMCRFVTDHVPTCCKRGANLLRATCWLASGLVPPCYGPCADLFQIWCRFCQLAFCRFVGSQMTK